MKWKRDEIYEIGNYSRNLIWIKLKGRMKLIRQTSIRCVKYCLGNKQ